MQASYYSVNTSNFKNNQNHKTEGLSSITTTTTTTKNKSKSQQQHDSSWKHQQSSSYSQLQQQHVLFGVEGRVTLTCRQQKIQMASGDVYVVQDLYGMNTSVDQDHDESDVNNTSKSKFLINIMFKMNRVL